MVVRPFAGEGARVTIGEPEANDVFLQVAKDLRRLTPRTLRAAGPSDR